MYKVMHWYETLILENDFAKVEHYFTDSKKALEYYYRQRNLYKNVALVVSTEHTEFVFMSHFNDNFPKELRPRTFTLIATWTDSTDKTISMYDVFEDICGFKRPKFRFKADGSVEEI